MASTAQLARRREAEPEWPVWLTVAIALGIGLLIAGMVLGRTETANAGPTMLAYPATWVRATESGAAFAAMDKIRGGVFGARVSVREIPKGELVAGEPSLSTVATGWSSFRSGDLMAYRVLAIAPAAVGGRTGARIDYAYLDLSPLGSASGAMPGLMRGIDTLVERGETYLVLTFAAESSDFARWTEPQFPRLRSTYDELLQSWRIP